MSRIPRHVPFYFLVTHSETCTLHFLVSESETSTIGQQMQVLGNHRDLDLVLHRQRDTKLVLAKWRGISQRAHLIILCRDDFQDLAINLIYYCLVHTTPCHVKSRGGWLAVTPLNLANHPNVPSMIFIFCLTMSSFSRNQGHLTLNLYNQ